MAVFFKTPAPPGVFDACDSAGSLVCPWAKAPDGRLSGRWLRRAPSPPAGEPHRLGAVR